MYKVKLMNKISTEGLNKFTADYEYGEDIQDEDAILLRSASLHEYEFGKNVKAIARAGAGVNNIPVDACSKKGIVVFNTPGANANAVKELVICGLLLSSRKIVEAMNWVQSQEGNPDIAKAAEKQKSNYVGPEIEGKTLGIVGLGAIGVQVANVAHKLGMTVIGYDPFLSVQSAWGLSKWVKYAPDLDTIYKESDYITIHVPSTKDTKGMIDSEAIVKMKNGVRLLNFARGDLINTNDVLAAIKVGKIAKYVTDFAAPELLNQENVLVLPHLGASTPESEDNCAKMAVNELKDYLENGNIVNSVNFPRVVQARESKVRICVINKNVPNILANISKLFADHHLNIENMVSRGKGEYAYTLVDTNDEVRADIIERMQVSPNIVSFRVIK